MAITRTDKNDSAIRPRTIFIGCDERGRDYLLKTETAPETVVVVADGVIVVRADLGKLRVEHVVATVADEIGWADCAYGWRAHEKGCPRKYGDRR
jgi:hypothetical protein